MFKPSNDKLSIDISLVVPTHHSVDLSITINTILLTSGQKKETDVQKWYWELSFAKVYIKEEIIKQSLIYRTKFIASTLIVYTQSSYKKNAQIDNLLML